MANKVLDYLRSVYRPQYELPQREEDKAVALAGAGWLSSIESYMGLDPGRQTRYADVDEMDERNPLISRGLDIVTDESAPLDPRAGRSFWVVSRDAAVETLGNRMLERIRLQDFMYDLARSNAKYGEVLRQLVYVTGEEARANSSTIIGIVALEPVPDPTALQPVLMHGRLLGWRGSGTVAITGNTGTLAPWDIWHVRLPGTSSLGTAVRMNAGLSQFHGRSWLEPARPIWRAIKASENALLYARITHSVERLLVPIPAEGVSPMDIPSLIQQYKRMERRWQVTDAGDFERRLDVMGFDENVYFPVTDTFQGEPKPFGGKPDIRGIEDLRYWQDLMFAAIGIPREYLQAERSGGGLVGKDLSHDDVRFARSVRRNQNALQRAIVELVRIELALHGKDPQKTQFEVRCAPISFVEEQQRLESLGQAVQVAQQLADLGRATGLDQRPEWKTFVLDTVITHVGWSLGLEALREEVASEPELAPVQMDIPPAEGELEPEVASTLLLAAHRLVQESRPWLPNHHCTFEAQRYPTLYGEKSFQESKEESATA